MQVSLELIQQLCDRLAKTQHSNLPRYKELYEALRQQILDGLLLPGMCLPSSRVMAKQLGIARNTVLAAIEQLCAEGYTSTRAKSGVYILATAPVNWDTNDVVTTKNSIHLSHRGEKIAEHARQALAMRGAFAAGVPDLKQFPFELWQRYIARYARNPRLDWQVNPQQGGDEELRQVLVNYLRITRGISCDPSQILITNGTQHSLQLIADLLANPGDHVWMEEPGYSGARCAFDAAGLVIIPQPVDAEGILLKMDAKQISPKFIYTTPSHQFPTGVVMTAARRRNLIALAGQHQAMIIEDDYDSEFRYEGAPIAALHALAPDQVIYLGTFSKIFFPALRIGYMILPQQFVDAFRATQARHLREPSYAVQRALAHFMRDGYASTHIRKMRREYQIRRDALVKLLQNELGELVRLDGLDTGMHFVAYLPTELDDQMIAAHAYQHGIMIKALSSYYTDSYSTKKSSGILLGFGDVNLQDIQIAGKKLCRIILEADKSKRKATVCGLSKVKY